MEFSAHVERQEHAVATFQLSLVRTSIRVKIHLCISLYMRVYVRFKVFLFRKHTQRGIFVGYTRLIF